MSTPCPTCNGWRVVDDPAVPEPARDGEHGVIPCPDCSSTDNGQLLLPGPTKIDCPDGCGRFGVPTRNGHVRGCTGPPGQPCRSCLGRRNRAKGQRKQRAARKAIPGVGKANSLGSDHEENWTGLVRVEVKAGAQVRPAVTAFRKMRAQSEASRAYGDHRPFVGIAMPDGESDGVLMIRVSDLIDVSLAVVASLEEDDGSR